MESVGTRATTSLDVDVLDLQLENEQLRVALREAEKRAQAAVASYNVRHPPLQPQLCSAQGGFL